MKKRPLSKRSASRTKPPCSTRGRTCDSSGGSACTSHREGGTSPTARPPRAQTAHSSAAPPLICGARQLSALISTAASASEKGDCAATRAAGALSRALTKPCISRSVGARRAARRRTASRCPPPSAGRRRRWAPQSRARPARAARAPARRSGRGGALRVEGQGRVRVRKRKLWGDRGKDSDCRWGTATAVEAVGVERRGRSRGGGG
eukprot:4620072-Pleurochrysis_carterae.AAC.1